MRTLLFDCTYRINHCLPGRKTLLIVIYGCYTFGMSKVLVGKVYYHFPVLDIPKSMTRHKVYHALVSMNTLNSDSKSL